MNKSDDIKMTKILEHKNYDSYVITLYHPDYDEKKSLKDQLKYENKLKKRSNQKSLCIQFKFAITLTTHSS